MKHLNLILAGIIVTSLIACGKNSPQGNIAPGMSGVSPGGTIDGGGGNTLNGKMLESYIVNPEELSGYEILKPLLDSLETRLKMKEPDDKNAEYTYFSPIAYILKSKPWYYVPENIATLSNERIGAPFLSGTEQVAFQTFDAIWIDQNAFEKMPNDEKAKLILHEIFMGLKILKMDSSDKFMSAFYFQNPSIEQAWVGGNNLIREARGDFKITPQDVDDVRTVTSQIWRLGLQNSNGGFDKKFDAGDYSRILVQNKFDRRIKFKFGEDIDSIGLYESNSGRRVSIETVISDVNDYSNFLFANHRRLLTQEKKDVLVAHSSCRVRLKKISDKQVEVSFALKAYSYATNSLNDFNKDELDRNSSYIFDIPENLRYGISGYRWFSGEELPYIYLVGKGPTPQTAHTVELLFDGQELAQARYAVKVIEAYEDSRGERIKVGTEVAEQGLIDRSILCMDRSEQKFE